MVKQKIYHNFFVNYKSNNKESKHNERTHEERTNQEEKVKRINHFLDFSERNKEIQDIFAKKKH